MDLLENGIDFIRSGIEAFYMQIDPKPRDHKYAIVHLFAGILLVLKERLRRDHPSLIFMRVEDAIEEDAKTVDFDTLVKRLTACTTSKLEDGDVRFLRSAQMLRNRLEHYQLDMNLKESEAKIGH